ncbi:MAG: formate dehydrogenase subunit delta [Pseudonocardia sp.]
MGTTTVPPHVRLVNEIAAQFAHRPPDEAAAEIAAHLRAFWERRMTTALLAHVEAGGADLEPVSARAATLLLHERP